MCGPCSRARAYVAEIAARYGAAFVLTTMSLSITMFCIIYACLRLGGFDARSYLLPYKAHISERLFSILETGGPFAVAFALNRLLSPLRLLISVLIVPKTAPHINALLRRIRPVFLPLCAPLLRVCPCLANFCCCCKPSDHPHASEDESEALLLDPDDDLEATEVASASSSSILMGKTRQQHMKTYSSTSISSSSSTQSSPSTSSLRTSHSHNSNPNSTSNTTDLFDLRLGVSSHSPVWKPASSTSL